MDNLYTVLGVDSKASPEEIKNAYRFLAMKFHPDKNPGNKEAEDRFKKINYAYSILINENKRKAYDEKNEGNDYQNQESAFSYEQAIYQFMNTMYAYAAEMTMKNIHSSKIAEFLISKGCPNGIAQTISISIENQRKTMVRKEAGWLFIKAIVSIFGGFVFTAITYGIASGIGGSRYVVFYGLVLYGIFNMFKALYYLVTGRVPQK